MMIVKKSIVIIALLSALSLVGCGESDGSLDSRNNDYYDERNESKKNESKETKDKTEYDMSSASAEDDEVTIADNIVEDMGLKDPKYYIYYENLAKSYVESGVSNRGGSDFENLDPISSISGPVCISGKLFFSFKGSNSSAFLYCYDIEDGSLRIIYEFHNADSKDRKCY